MTAAQGASPPPGCPVAGGAGGSRHCVRGQWPLLGQSAAPTGPRSSRDGEDTASEHPESPGRAAPEEEQEQRLTRSCVPHGFASSDLQKLLHGGKGWDMVTTLCEPPSQPTACTRKAGGNSAGAGRTPTNPNRYVRPQMGTAAGSTAQGPCRAPPGSILTHGGAHLTAIISDGGTPPRALAIPPSPIHFPIPWMSPGAHTPRPCHSCHGGGKVTCVFKRTH